MAYLASGIVCLLSLTALTFGDHVREMQIAPRNGFSWDNCNKSAPFDISALSVSPDPIQPASTITVSFAVDVKQDIGTTNTLQADIDAKLITQGITVDVCDYVAESTCHPKDLCAIFKQVKHCPDVVKKLDQDCRCPLKKKVYNINKATIKIPSVPVSGLLKVHVTVSERNQQMACLDLNMCIGSCETGTEEMLNAEKLPGNGGP